MESVKDCLLDIAALYCVFLSVFLAVGISLAIIGLLFRDERYWVRGKFAFWIAGLPFTLPYPAWQQAWWDSSEIRIIIDLFKKWRRRHDTR